MFLPCRLAAAASLFAAILSPAQAGDVVFRLTDSQGQPVADAVLSLAPIDAAPPPPAVNEPVEIVQQGEMFVPYVTPVRVGTAVKFPNRDKVQHHAYSLSPAKKFELPLYGGEVKPAVVFDRGGIVAIGCNIHDWMAAYVVVLDTPWFAKSNDEGNATVTSVPAGRYRAEVWHPRLGKTEQVEVVVAADAPLRRELTLVLKPDRRIRRAPAASGGGYR